MIAILGCGFIALGVYLGTEGESDREFRLALASFLTGSVLFAIQAFVWLA